MEEVFASHRVDLKHIKRKWLDLPYADHSEAQKLDIYIPNTGKGPFPVIVTIHGGGWLSGDKGDANNLHFLEALKRDYALVCINYRLTHEAQFPCQIYDCKAAIRFIRTNARKYHLDGNYIGVWGASAGGYLAALLGTSAKVKELEDHSIKNSNTRTTSQVQAVVAWHAPIGDFLKLDNDHTKSGIGTPNHADSKSPESRLLGRALTDVPAFVKFASPLTYLDEYTAPFLIQHGAKDEVIPVKQSLRFAAELEKIAGGSKLVLEVIKDAKHADPIFKTPKNIQRVLDFFDLFLKAGQKNAKNNPSHYAIKDSPLLVDSSHIKRKFLDIPYAFLSASQKLDIYLPKRRRGPFPVIMAFHGGAFMGGDKADQHILPILEGLKRNYAVVGVNYRLSGDAKFPAQVHDVKAAVRWIRRNAKHYKLNPDKIVAWGSAAGGYLATMLGVTAGISELEALTLGNPDYACNVQAVVSWYGPTNFLKMDEFLDENGLLPPPGFRHNDPKSPESLLFGQSITEIPEKIRTANPEIYIQPDAPPFLLQHGIKDATVPYQQSVKLAEKLKQVTGENKVVLELFEGADHGDEIFETPKNVNRVLDFIDTCLK